MDMYANGSSFGASLTLQSSNSFRDVSFSSYLNQTEEKMIQKITNDHHCPKKSEDDDELDVFGAENYFKEEVEDVESKIGRKIVDDYEFGSKVEEFDRINMNTPSVRSNVSCNSRVGLLPRSNQPLGISESGDKTRTKTKIGTKTNFLARFGCNCINKKSTQISDKRLIQSKEISKPHMKMLDFDKKIKLAERKTEKDYFGLIPNIELTQRGASVGPHQKSEGPGYYRSRKSNDYFSFPVLNSNDLISKSNSDRSNSKYGNLASKVDGNNNNSSGNSNSNGRRLSLGKKLSLLNDWDVDIPPKEELYIPRSGMYNNDEDSDSSSDLFEIESFSTTGNNSFIAPRESNCYAPSEVSVDWSVVTASAAEFSVVSDYHDMRTGSGGWRISVKNDHDDVGILSSCVSHKAVRVAEDEHKVGRGATGGRRRLSNSMAVGSLFRGGIL